MLRTGVSAVLAFSLLLIAPRISAQQNLVPAGTILRCTLDEPHLSPASADIGDPVLCHLNAAQRFGWVSFPRGAYLAGHVDAQKKLSNFGTHGSMTVVFDRIGWSSGTVPARSKVIAVKNYTIDHNGKIVGGWLSDPVLKGESSVTVRLMDDVQVPLTMVSYGPGWHFFSESPRR